jgi:hypothetical protein
MYWLINSYTVLARALTWVGSLAIVVLSIVPADDRPVTGFGQNLEHFAVFALAGAVFAIGYHYHLCDSWWWLLSFAPELSCFKFPCRQGMQG